MESQIREWDRKIDALKDKISASKEERSKHQAELKALQEKRHAVKSRFDELKEAADDAWDDVRDGLDHAWDDLRRAGEVVTSYFKQARVQAGGES